MNYFSGIAPVGSSSYFDGVRAPVWLTTGKVVAVVGALAAAGVLFFMWQRWKGQDVDVDDGELRGRDVVLQKNNWNLNLVVNKTPIYQRLSPSTTPADLFMDTKEEDWAEVEIQRSFGEVVRRAKASVKWLLFATDELKKTYGSDACSFSSQELTDVLNSQKIHLSSTLYANYTHVSSTLSTGCYKTLKRWILRTENNDLLKDPKQVYPEQVLREPRVNNLTKEIQKCSIGQIAAMVVLSEDFHPFLYNGKIIKREPGETKPFRLITASGVATFSSDVNRHCDEVILTETFKTVLEVAEKGIVIIATIGLDEKGITIEDVKLHWRSFFAAIRSSCADKFEQIFVNPRHRIVDGYGGSEFQGLLQEQLITNPHPNLDKIRDLNKLGGDLGKGGALSDVDLAYGLKTTFPLVPVSLVKGGKPAETLGGQVCRGGIAEVGTRCFTSEAATEVAEDSERICESSKCSRLPSKPTSSGNSTTASISKHSTPPNRSVGSDDSTTSSTWSSSSSEESESSFDEDMVTEAYNETPKATGYEFKPGKSPAEVLFPSEGSCLFLQQVQKQMAESIRALPDEICQLPGTKGVDGIKELYGNQVYSISHAEIISDMDSWTIHLSSLLPRKAYQDRLKKIKAEDSPPTRTPLPSYLQIFTSDLYEKESIELNQCSLGQFAAMVVKCGDFHLCINNGKFIKRHVGDKDSFRLIRASGVAGYSVFSNQSWDVKIMQATFQTIFMAAKRGVLIISPIGLTSASDEKDREAHWKAFFEAIINDANLMQLIYVSPYVHGTECPKFDTIFTAMQKKYPAHLNLQKIRQLLEGKRDVDFAYNLRKKDPNMRISVAQSTFPGETLGGGVCSIGAASFGTAALSSEIATGAFEKQRIHANWHEKP